MISNIPQTDRLCSHLLSKFFYFPSLFIETLMLR